VAEAGLCSGLRWSAISMVGREVSRAVFIVAPARLVGPGDFGIVAHAMVYVGIVALLLDQGFSGVLISRKHTEKEPDQVDGGDNGSRFCAVGNDKGWGKLVRAVDGFPDTVSASAWTAEPDRVATKSRVRPR
jgi:Polysaccharide biosynthesis protein